MPKKKTKENDLLEPTEQSDLPEGEDTSVPSEETEDFGQPAESGGSEAQFDAVPEPDMAHAPDFWSEASEVSSADSSPTEYAEPIPVIPETVMERAEASAEATDSEDIPETPAQNTNSGFAELPQPEGAIPYRPEEDEPQEPQEQQGPQEPQERVPSRPGLMAEGAERRAFFDLDFHELDRNLSAQERQEWNNIYASFRGHSVMTGKIAGIDPHDFRIRDRRTGEILTRTFYCAVVIPFRVPILIPETELWFRGEERPRNVTRNIGGATIDFVITQLDRKANFVLASRRLALASRRYFFSTQPQMNSPGSRLECSILTVGNRQLPRLRRQPDPARSGLYGHSRSKGAVPPRRRVELHCEGIQQPSEPSGGLGEGDHPEPLRWCRVPPSAGVQPAGADLRKVRWGRLLQPHGRRDRHVQLLFPVRGQ